MTNQMPVAYALDPRCEYSLWGVDKREPKRAGFTHVKRQRHEWVCFLPIRGDLELIDFFPQGEQQMQVPQGHVHIIPPGVWQSFARPMAADAAFLWWHFVEMERQQSAWTYCDHQQAFQLIHQQLSEQKQNQWLLPVQCDLSHCLGEFSNLHQSLCQMNQRWSFEDYGSQVLIKHIMHRIHQEYCQSMMETAAPTQQLGSADEKHAQRAQWYIHMHARSVNNLSELAAIMGINPEYLARCCKSVLGKSVGELILEQRMRNAQDLMRSGEYSLKEISHHCGFSSLNYFCRRFKQMTGITASEWRRSIL